MEHIPVIAGLLAKREEIARQVAELERQIRRHKADIAQLDATIGLFAADVTQARREVTRFARSAGQAGSRQALSRSGCDPRCGSSAAGGQPALCGRLPVRSEIV
jgi:hypothetical protein